MMEYIERESVRKEIQKQRNFYLNEREGETDLEKLFLLYGSDNAITTMEDILSDIPAADVAPVVHGHWEVEEEDWGFCEATGERHIHKKFKCSVCGYTTGYQAEKFVCCPICTARMDGGQHETD